VKISDLVQVSRAAVLCLHRGAIAETWGSHGVRDDGLLASAMARPTQAYGSELVFPSLAKMAAALVVGIIRNHPFVDGNKRTGLLAGLAMIELNGFLMPHAQEQWVKAAVDIACHRMSEELLADMFAEAMGGDCPIELDD